MKRLKTAFPAAGLALLILVPAWGARSSVEDAGDKRLRELYDSPTTSEANKQKIAKHLADRESKRKEAVKVISQRRNQEASRRSHAPAAQVRIFPARGGLVRRRRALLLVPPGAIAADLIVSASEPDPAQDAARQAKMTAAGLSPVLAPVAFGPDDTVFNAPATITFSYHPRHLGDVREADLRIYSWDAAAGNWRALDSKVDADRRTVSALIVNLSTYQLLAPSGAAK